MEESENVYDQLDALATRANQQEKQIAELREIVAKLREELGMKLGRKVRTNAFNGSSNGGEVYVAKY